MTVLESSRLNFKIKSLINEAYVRRFTLTVPDSSTHALISNEEMHKIEKTSSSWSSPQREVLGFGGKNVLKIKLNAFSREQNTPRT